jgi:D-amino-acid dehydrogenase
MNVIVLGGGVAGVTTAYLLKDGHEGTQLERQPGVARECSHTNGGFVAISQAVTWPAGRADQDLQVHGAAPTRRSLIHPSQLRRVWRWGLDFLRASRPGPSWANTRHILRLSLYSFEALKEIRAAPASNTTPSPAAPSRYSNQRGLR